MTIHRAGSPKPHVAHSSSTSAAATAKPKTASASHAAASHATDGDKFHAGPAAKGGIGAGLADAREMLAGLDDQSEAVTDLTKLLEKAVPTKSDFDKVIDHYGELAPKLTDKQRATLEKALSFQLMGRTALDAFKQQMEKMMADLGKKPE